MKRIQTNNYKLTKFFLRADDNDNDDDDNTIIRSSDSDNDDHGADDNPGLYDSSFEDGNDNDAVNMDVDDNEFGTSDDID